MKKIATLLISAALLCIGIAVAQDQNEQASADIEERYNHLEKGKSGFKETWVNPNTDWTQFDKLYLWGAEFQYRDVGPARRSRLTMMNTRQREFGISDRDRQRFEKEVSEAFTKEIQKAKKFTIADEIGPNTLIMRGAALDIVSKVPPETVGRSEVYLSNVGEATLVLELIDASDGEVVAVVAERRAMQSGTGRIDEFSTPANTATVFAEVRRWATRAARKFRDELDKAIAGG
jgi:hypothetical protein